jgi:hypothetical protein
MSQAFMIRLAGTGGIAPFDADVPGAFREEPKESLFAALRIAPRSGPRRLAGFLG